MKYQIWIYVNLLLFFSSSITAQNNSITTPSGHAPQQITIPINNYITPQTYIDNNNTSSNKNASSNENTSINTNKATQLMAILASRLYYWYGYAKSIDPKKCNQYIFQLLKKNKYKIAKYSVTCSYIGILLLLFSSHYYLDKPDVWANWQASTPFTELCTKPSHLLQQELIFDIQKRYINIQNPSDFMSPFVAFMNKITEEETHINRYLILLNSVNRLHMQRLFFINEKKIKKAESCKQRLALVKQLFLSWAAEFNINQYSKQEQKK
ncbi:MAG: hypothetical protein WCD44_01145 [Candidatus Babeliales bacterium]|jgi:hypothetical protein